MAPLHFETLVLGPGGFSCLAIGGACLALYKSEGDDGPFHTCRVFAGSSSGAILATLFAIFVCKGKTIEEAVERMVAVLEACSHALSSFFYALPYGSYINALHQVAPGFIRPNPSHEVALGILDCGGIRKFLMQLYERDYTFAELDGVSLSVSALHMNNLTVRHFNSRDDADMSVIDAVICSCALPGVFNPPEYQGVRYVDAALYERFPLVHGDNVFTIIVETCKMKSTESSTPLAFFSNIFSVIMMMRENKDVAETPHRLVISVEKEDKLFSPTMSFLDRLEIVFDGMNESLRWKNAFGK